MTKLTELEKDMRQRLHHKLRDKPCAVCRKPNTVGHICRDRSHYIEMRIYDNDGDLIKMRSSIVPGDYEYTEQDEKYLAWLDERREKRVIVESE